MRRYKLLARRGYKTIEVAADLAGRIVTIVRYSNRKSVINHTGAFSSVNWICLYSR